MPRPAKNKGNLTDRFCQFAKCPPEASGAEYLDAKVQGLALRVRPSGHRSWAVRFRVTNGRHKGKQQRLGLGDYPAVSLDEARARALELTSGAARGIDPNALNAANMTIGAVLDAYIERHAKPNLKSWEQKKTILDQHVRPRLGALKLSGMRKADVIELLDHMQDATGDQGEKKFMAQINRVLDQINAVLNWTVDLGWLEANPAAKIKDRIKETARKRVLTGAELRALWQTAEALPEPSRSLVMAWMLTGQRRDEVRCMPPSEINPDATLWTLPAERNKAKREHKIPLSRDMTALLIARRAAVAPKGSFLFSIDGTKPYAGQVRLKKILDRGMTQALRKSGALADDGEVAEWILHDIRRTVATGMAELGVQDEVISRCLNHSIKGSITHIYNRHDYLEAKRAAFEAWAVRLASVVNTGRDAPNVKEFPARA